MDDPRFAYLKMCQDLKVFPRLRSTMVHERKTSHFDYSNKGLLNKNAIAVAEGLKLYQMAIESINLTNNGLKAKDSVILIQAMERHYAKL